MKLLNRHGLVLLVLSWLAVAERVWWDWGPNIELVTTVSILAGMYIPKRYTWLVPLLVMGISDAAIGMGLISWFTWTGFVVIVVFPIWIKKLFNQPLLFGTLSGLLGNLWFYLWTNWGVWLTDSWSMYPNTLTGLISCYIKALPFLRLQLVSTLLFLPVSIGLMETVKTVWIGTALHRWLGVGRWAQR